MAYSLASLNDSKHLISSPAQENLGGCLLEYPRSTTTAPCVSRSQREQVAAPRHARSVSTSRNASLASWYFINHWRQHAFPLSHHSVYLVLPLNSSNFGRIAMPTCLVPLAFDRKLEVRNKSPLFSRGVGLRYAWYCHLGLGIDDETASRNESKRCTRQDSSEQHWRCDSCVCDGSDWLLTWHTRGCVFLREDSVRYWK
jgi:hypothetical protein